MSRLLTSFILLSTSLTFCQNYHVPYRKGNLWGFADKTGKIIIEPKYDSVEPKMDNLRWFVYKNNKTGILNPEGKEIIAVEYDSVFRNPVHSQANEFYIHKNGKTAYADMDGTVIIPLKYDLLKKAAADDFNHSGLKFLVKNKDSDWQLIDSKDQVLLSDIEGFSNNYSGNFKIKKKNKYGIYNLQKRAFIVQPEYDSINYFDYKDFYRPKAEFKDAKYYGVKDKTFTLFSPKFEPKETSITKLDNFFEMPTREEYGDSMVESVVSAENGSFAAVSGDNFNDGKLYELSHYYRTDPKSVRIIQNKNLYGLVVNYPLGMKQSEIEFDEIRLLKYTYGSYNKQIAMVRKKKKWGIFDMMAMKMISSFAYDAFELHKRYDRIIILKSKGKIGLYEIEDDRDKELSTVIEPLYDSFEKFEYIRSTDYNYDNFNLYFFRKNGKVCPVGINGVKFYQD